MALDEETCLKHVQTLLDSIQLVSAAEVINLASKLGLNVTDTYYTISNSAGTSKIFDTVVPNILNVQGRKPAGQTVKTRYAALKSALDVARNPNVCFAAPIATTAETILLAAISAGLGDKPDSDIWRFWQNFGGNDLSKQVAREKDRSADLRAKNLARPKRIAFIGLGSMGLGQALVLHNAGFDVIGYDNYPPCLESFQKQGGKCATSPKDCATDADVLVFMPVLLSQAENVLFQDGAITTLKKDAVVVLCSTSPPTDARRLGQRIKDYSAAMEFVDAPVSGGAVRSAKGDLVIMASGAEAAIVKVFPVLDAFASTLGNYSNLKILSTGLGAGSSTKAMIQHLAGTNAVGGAEAIAFAARLGLDTEKAYDMLVENGAGFIFTNRLGRTVTGSRVVESKTDIMTKDLNIVVSESAAVGLPCFMPAIAHTQLLQACASGWTKEDDCCVIKVWTALNKDDAVGAKHRSKANGQS